MELFGVGGVLAPDDDHHVGLSGQFGGCVLIFEGGVADGVEDPHLFRAQRQRPDDLEKVLRFAGRLGNDGHFGFERKFVQIFGIENDESVAGILGITDHPFDLGMVLVAEDHDAVAFPAHLFDDLLRSSDIRAGGVDDLFALGFELFELVFRDAVGSDDDGIGLLRLFETLDQTDVVPLFEPGDFIFVVDQRTVGGAAWVLFGDADRPLDPVTEPVGGGEFDFHRV